MHLPQHDETAAPRSSLFVILVPAYCAGFVLRIILQGNSLSDTSHMPSLKQNRQLSPSEKHNASQHKNIQNSDDFSWYFDVFWHHCTNHQPSGNATKSIKFRQVSPISLFPHQQTQAFWSVPPFHTSSNTFIISSLWFLRQASITWIKEYDLNGVWSSDPRSLAAQLLDHFSPWNWGEW